MKTELADLAARVGPYGGYGITGADQPFHGELTLSALPGGAGIDLDLRMTGIDGTEYAVVRGWIAVDEGGSLALWAVSTTTPWVERQALRRSFPVLGAERVLVFGTGEEHDLDAVRLETTMELWPDGSVGIRQRHAQPGGGWVTRAAVRCRPAL